MLDALPPVPAAYRGLWERTLLERYGTGTLTDDRPARVFWLQTERWHADLRIPLERPDFAGIGELPACSDAQLAFLAGQEGFCGLTRVEGRVCTWARLFDLRPGAMLDAARMEPREDLLVEHGIAEAYREEWTLVAGSRGDGRGSTARRSSEGDLILTAGDWRVVVRPRPAAPEGVDPYQPVAEAGRGALLWRASLALTLCRRDECGWRAVHSTHPWLEGLSMPHEAALPCG
jgi:hypothetical protein